jgi:hypothetical protein
MDTEYTYDVIGENFQRDHLVQLVRDVPSTGELFLDAILEPEPTNIFDPNAVKVIISGVQVGYIPKFDSECVTKMITKSKKPTMSVKARIGWDVNNP